MARIVRIHQTGGPDVLRLDEIDPAPPGPGEIALQVKALGLNRAESMFRSGHYVEQPVFPARLGYEAAGVVSALGPGVTGFAIGDAVSIVPPLSISRWGTYGEVATVPADVAVKHPASLGWTEAAAVWMQYVTAWGALIDLAQIKRGDAVVITALPQLADALAFGGIVIEYGALAAEQAPFPLFAVLGKMLSVHGYQYKRVVGDPAKLDAAKRFVLDGLASGALKPAIDRVFPLDRIADAHRYLESNEQFGKIVVTV